METLQKFCIFRFLTAVLRMNCNEGQRKTIRRFGEIMTAEFEAVEVVRSGQKLNNFETPAG
jgi:hypothetical protein